MKAAAHGRRRRVRGFIAYAQKTTATGRAFGSGEGKGRESNKERNKLKQLLRLYQSIRSRRTRKMRTMEKKPIAE